MRCPRALTPEEAQTMLDMLPTATSLREIGRAMGLRQDIVRQAAAPFIALMRVSGALTPCPCGKPRFHPYGCSGDHNILKRKGVRPPVSDALLAKRAMAIEMLVAGLPYRHVDDAMGMGRGCARGYMRFLTPEQCDERAAAVRRRGSKRKYKAPADVQRERGSSAGIGAHAKSSAPNPAYTSLSI